MTEETSTGTGEWRFDDLRALYVNCTLQRSPEPSHTQGLIDVSVAIMERHGVTVEQLRAVDHDIGHRGVARHDRARPGGRLPAHRQRGRGRARRHEPPLQPPAPRLHHPAPGRRRLDRRGRFTNRNTTFATWNLMHLGALLKRSGGIPAHGNQRSEWDAGCRFDFENPEHR
jgi:hypothetical protein